MEAATQAWHSMSYVEGFLFTVWIVSLYWGKKRIDLHFDRKMHKNRSLLKKAVSTDSTRKIDKKWF
tara:strand:+ start:447 stop:644 length:198 start_codon:yes stop_codon:yes gene_type:complete